MFKPFLFLSLMSFFFIGKGNCSEMREVEILSPRQKVNQILPFLFSQNNEKASPEVACHLKNQNLNEWISSAKFLLELVDYPPAESNECEFFEWLDSRSNKDLVIFSQDQKIENVTYVTTRNYLWDVLEKKIVKLPTEGTKVSNIIESLGNQYLGINRGLSSRNEQTDLDPFLVWSSSLNTYLRQNSIKANRAPVYNGKEDQKSRGFSLSLDERRALKTVHIFKTEYWLHHQKSSNILATVFKWKDIDERSRSLCFSVDKKTEKKRSVASLPKSFANYKTDQDKFEFFHRLKNCSNEKKFFWNMTNWLNQQLLGFRAEQLVAILPIWESNKNLFQSKQQSKDFLFQALGIEQ